MATLTVQTAVEAGVAPSYAACAGGGDEFVNGDDERVFVHVKNTNAATRTVTFVAQRGLSAPGYAAIAALNLAVIVPANTGDLMIGPFPAGRYNDANGKVQMTYSAVTNLSIAVVRVARPAG